MTATSPPAIHDASGRVFLSKLFPMAVRLVTLALMIGGIAGIQLEDQLSPMRSSTVGAPELVPAEEFVPRIRAACEARKDKDFVIIERTDARMVEGLDAASPG